MNVAEALSIAKQYLNHYRAFEKIKEVLELVSIEENTLRERIAQRTSIEAEIAKLGTLKTEITAELNENRVALEGLKKDHGELKVVHEKLLKKIGEFKKSFDGKQ